MSISNIGITLPEDERYSSGIGYIAIPADLDRAKYILDCYQNHRVSIHTEQNGYMNRVQISEEDLNYIQFPEDHKKFGTPVYYILDPVNHQPYIIKRYNSSNVLGTGSEHRFKMGRSFGNSFVEMSGNPKTGNLNLVVSSEADSQINLVVNNREGNGKINIEVLGDVNVSATGTTSFIQNEALTSVTVDPKTDQQTEIAQKTDSVGIVTPKLKINDGKENFILGQQFKAFMVQLITEISTATANGSPLSNAVTIATYTQKIDSLLSQVGFIDK